MILAIDVSASSLYSSQKDLRKDAIANVAASLAFVAHENKDKVGVLFFSDTVEKWIAPSRGDLHVGKIVETIFSLEPHSKKTNISHALRFLVNLKKRNSIVFMLSDWIDTIADYRKLLKVASVEYDFVVLRFLDRCEQEFPDIGILDIFDPENQSVCSLDSRNKKTITKFFSVYKNKQKHLFDKYKIDFLDLMVGKPFVNDLIMFFHQRIRRQIR